ncbi:GTPase of the mitochondrial inner membrane that associates with the large ribosomal subunit [Coemansia sp. Benny D160-2]|nr:GTPase of the mitochondrial inner membrane that associates with the large ribosomal subunit [Coemansia sp. Benny D160-2]
MALRRVPQQLRKRYLSDQEAAAHMSASEGAAVTSRMHHPDEAEETEEGGGDPSLLDPAASAPAATAFMHHKQQKLDIVRRNTKAGRNFVDRMRCTAVGGHGGNGCVSFFRDSFVPNGPPNGGDGGGGGGVWLVVDENETSLSCVKQMLRAQPGANGRGKAMHGQKGNDLVVKVPKGTMVREHLVAPDSQNQNQNQNQSRNTDFQTQEAAEQRSDDSSDFLYSLDRQITQSRESALQSRESMFVHYPRWEERNNVEGVRIPAEYMQAKHEIENAAPLSVDLLHHGQRVLVARGGAGGPGNPHFISADTRHPHYALHGLGGQRRTLELELKTIADVGLVGMPNAGKSTFLRAVSNAHPKVAPYPFTTLNPYIGTVTFVDSFQMTVADIPGLIPGAHRNVGLGHAFLRHVERSRLLAFIVDVSRQAPWLHLRLLRAELELYQPGLTARPTLVIANKADRPESRQNFERWSQMPGAPLLVPVSAKNRKNILKATHAIRQILESTQQEQEQPGVVPHSV